jgi:hypothetical protein
LEKRPPYFGQNANVKGLDVGLRVLRIVCMKEDVRYAWTKFDSTTRTHVRDDEKARGWLPLVVVVDGVPRWVSNNLVPPQDCLNSLAAVGLVFDMAKAQAARNADTLAFLEAYRKNPPVLDEEARYEMRAAFGPGVEVVDIISGQRTRT